MTQGMHLTATAVPGGGPGTKGAAMDSRGSMAAPSRRHLRQRAARLARRAGVRHRFPGR